MQRCLSTVFCIWSKIRMLIEDTSLRFKTRCIIFLCTWKPFSFSLRFFTVCINVYSSRIGFCVSKTQVRFFSHFTKRNSVTEAFVIWWKGMRIEVQFVSINRVSKGFCGVSQKKVCEKSYQNFIKKCLHRRFRISFFFEASRIVEGTFFEQGIKRGVIR